MNVEFVEALNELCKTRRIKKEVLLEAIEQALMSAYKKNFDSASNARVTLDAITGEVAVYAQKKVVEQVENPQLEIAADNPAVDNKYQLGDIVEVEVTPRNFGRIAAQAAKQVIVQRIREAERGVIYDEYIEKEAEILTAIVLRVEGKTVYVDLNRTEGVLEPSQQMPEEEFHVGDRINVVGPRDNVNRVAEMMGNSERKLNAPNLGTIFIGIMVGLIFGSLPVAIPGMPVPLKLGLAGGPLIIAILIGRWGTRFHLITYMTTSANLMLREFGLALFLASVGIKAGAGFWETVVAGDGLKYVLCGFLITIIPILIVGTIARLKFKFNFFTVMGMIAGTYTDPPALAYANSVCQGEASAIGYSTVYPLSMFLRILAAQVVVLFFCGA